MRNDSAAPAEPTVRAVEWRQPPSELTPPACAVHVWRVDLDSGATCLHRLERNLSPDERERAARFRFARDRERFVAARGLLREILALYLDTEARWLSFGYGAHGKPFLVKEEHSTLRFSVSHSLSTMLVAVAHKREVGVDIERVSADISVKEIAGTVFSTPEKRALTRFEGEAKRIAFFRLWTRKEAYIKADGRGVSLPLEHIDGSCSGGPVAMLHEASGEWRACARWMLKTLAVGPDYAAALVAEDRDWQLMLYQWPG